MIDFFLVCLTSILFVVDPLGALPAFLVMTSADASEKRRQTALKASLTAGLTLAVFAVAGVHILHLFGISLAAFRIAGGLVLLLVAFDMMRAQRPTQEGPGEVAEGSTKEDIAITPLAIPMLAGPASLSAVTVLITKASSFQQTLTVHFAIAITALICYVVLRSADRLFAWFGRTGIHVFSRVLGLVLAAISVQFVIDGIREANLFENLAASPLPSANSDSGNLDSVVLKPRIATRDEFLQAIAQAIERDDRALEFQDALITDELLTELDSAAQLQVLIFEKTDISDAGVAHLAKLVNLRTLVLGKTRMTSTGAAMLVGLRELSRLSLESSELSDEALVHLGKLSNLELVRLGSSNITGSGFSHLAALPKLRFLILQNAQIRDESLKPLQRASQLESVYLEGNPLDGQGVASLKEALPNLHIHW